MNNKDITIQSAIKMPASLMARIDKLAEAMSKQDVQIRRSQVMRIAMKRGLDLMEAEYKEQQKARSPRK